MKIKFKLKADKKKKSPKVLGKEAKLRKIRNISFILTLIFGYIAYVGGFILSLSYLGVLGQYILKALGWKIIFGSLLIKSLGAIKYNGYIVNVAEISKVRTAIMINFGVVITLVGIIFLVIIAKLKNTKDKDSHGSAHWGTYNDLDFTSAATKPFETSLLNDDGVVLGRFEGTTLRDNAKTHILVSAPTRTGKGVSLIIPTLIDTWSDSVVVLDIKGENYQKTSGARKKLFDNRIIRFAPKSHHSSRFNPLGEIRFMTEYELEDVKLICNMLCQGEGDSKGNDKFWEDKASSLLSGVILYELYKRFLMNPGFIKNKKGEDVPVSPANLTNVFDFFRDPTYTDTVQKEMGKKKNENLYNYAATPEIAEYVKSRLLKLHSDTNLVLNGMHPNISKIFTEIINNPENTFGSILSTATQKIDVFGIDVVRKNTSASDFRINDIMNYEKPVSLYLVVEPSAIVLMAPLIRILLVQMINLLTPEMDYNNENNNHKWKCLLLLDEFPAIGKMEVLEKGIGYVAGYKMKIMIILQSLDQLYKIYGKENMFLSNCQVQVFYTANDVTTADYVNKSLGKETISTYTKPRGGGAVMKSENETLVGRDLLTPDEVRRFPLDKILLLVAGKPPFKADKIRYFEEKDYLERSNIPYVYSESCYDKTLQYYKNTTGKYPEIDYVPYRSAIKGLVELYKEDLAGIKRLEFEGKPKQEIKMAKNKADKMKETLSKYIELIDMLKPVMKKDMDEKKAFMEQLKKSKIENNILVVDDITSYSDALVEIPTDDSEINNLVGSDIIDNEDEDMFDD